MSKFCTQCGSPIAENASFCGNCGAKQENSVNFSENPAQGSYSAPSAPENQPQYYSAPQNYAPPAKQKKKGGALKILLVICIIIILILVGAVACLALSGNDEPTPEIPVAPESSILPESEAPADVPAVESQAPAEEEYYGDAYLDEVVAALEPILEASAPDSIIYDEIYHQDGILYYNYSIAGVAEAVYGAKSYGYDETFPAWVEYRETTIDLYDSVVELLHTLGYYDVSLAMMVLNDENFDNVFITIYEGIVIYDVMAD